MPAAEEQLISELEDLVRAETPSYDRSALAAFAELFAARFNVVAAHASAEVSFRMNDRADAERIAEALNELRPRREGATVELEGGSLWPPMERTEASDALARQAVSLAAELGFELATGHAGGASDGCHCAAVGAAVLDGLGGVGRGAHAEDEHVSIGELPRRIELLSRLLENRQAEA